MKTFKLLVAYVAIFLGINVLFADDQPPKVNKTELATLMVEKLEIDIVLTDSQKVAIQKIAEDYLNKRQNAARSKTVEVAHSMRIEAEATYKAAVDNLLTEEQQTTLQVKREEARRNNNPNNCCK
ncbi:MAG: hypothetical protein BGO29_03920 [Bacteroidales bacterium 36-12]|nr:MAG: hypothetical protein BGO29_03920 [Bacteroidales bacterium 36-12]